MARPSITGTSASAAHVAAAAALLRAADGSLSNGAIVGRLARTADAAGTAAETGNGRLNLARAFADTSTGSVQPAGAAPVGDGGPFVGPYTAASKATISGTVQSSAAGNPPISGAIVACTLDSADSSAPTGVTGAYTLTANYSGNATVTLTASAPGYASQSRTITPGNGSPPDTTGFDFTLTPLTPVDLAVTKTDSPDPVNAGTNLTYTITVSSNGPSNVTGATVTDTFDTTKVGPIGSITWTCAITTGTGNCGGATGSGNISRAINLNNGAVATFVVTAPVLANASGSVGNTAAATVPAGFFDGTSGNDSASTSTTITSRADIGITKTDSPDPVIAGNNLTYTITVTNNSIASTGSAATGISVSDTIPAGTTLVSATGTGWVCAGTSTVTCTRAASLAVATAAPAITIVVTVDANTVGGTSLSNTATATTTTFDPTTPNSATTTTAVSSIDLIATKTNNVGGTVAQGGSFTWTIVAKNQGTSRPPRSATPRRS